MTRPENQPHSGPVARPSVGRPDTFTALVETVDALTRRFPDHNGAFARVSRLAEETGELAQQVNHAEGMGVKVTKHGPHDPAKMVKELMDVLRTTIGLAAHYGLVDELRALIDAGYHQHIDMGLIEAPKPDGEHPS